MHNQIVCSQAVNTTAICRGSDMLSAQEDRFDPQTLERMYASLHDLFFACYECLAGSPAQRYVAKGYLSACESSTTTQRLQIMAYNLRLLKYWAGYYGIGLAQLKRP